MTIGRRSARSSRCAMSGSPPIDDDRRGRDARADGHVISARLHRRCRSRVLSVVCQTCPADADPWSRPRPIFLPDRSPPRWSRTLPADHELCGSFFLMLLDHLVHAVLGGPMRSFDRRDLFGSDSVWPRSCRPSRSTLAFTPELTETSAPCRAILAAYDIVDVRSVLTRSSRSRQPLGDRPRRPPFSFAGATIPAVKRFGRTVRWFSTRCGFPPCTCYAAADLSYPKIFHGESTE